MDKLDQVKLDKEEKELLESFDQDEWTPVADLAKEADRYREYARATFKKDMRVNIRISKKDLDALQVRALEEGIPYQTLIGSVLHKYVDGRLVEKGR
ncbi:MAG: antitoxin [Chloroflexi bacterium]|nr:antitoxin [Chloroflexota bacterium]MDA1270900.1 antitoxin [Chloroflexota bacterium]